MDHMCDFCRRCYKTAKIMKKHKSKFHSKVKATVLLDQHALGHAPTRGDGPQGEDVSGAEDFHGFDGSSHHEGPVALHPVSSTPAGSGGAPVAGSFEQAAQPSDEERGAASFGPFEEAAEGLVDADLQWLFTEPMINPPYPRQTRPGDMSDQAAVENDWLFDQYADILGTAEDGTFEDLLEYVDPVTKTNKPVCKMQDLASLYTPGVAMGGAPSTKCRHQEQQPVQQSMQHNTAGDPWRWLTNQDAWLSKQIQSLEGQVACIQGMISVDNDMRAALKKNLLTHARCKSFKTEKSLKEHIKRTHEVKGNENLAAFTATKEYRLRVDLGDWSNNFLYAEYSLFKVGDASTKFTLITLGIHSGNASDSLKHHRGSKFSTHDRDNDANVNNCATALHGAWWYNSCRYSNLNGKFNTTNDMQGIFWQLRQREYYSLRFTEMKIRPVKM
jgi:hypothetical protein